MNIQSDKNLRTDNSGVLVLSNPNLVKPRLHKMSSSTDRSDSPPVNLTTLVSKIFENIIFDLISFC